MSNDDQKLTRRHFLQQAAVLTALTGGVVGMVLTTDAVSEEPITMSSLRSGDDGFDYRYF